MPTLQTPVEPDEQELATAHAKRNEEVDTTRNWVPLALLIIAVPFMLGVFVLVGYWIMS